MFIMDNVSLSFSGSSTKDNNVIATFNANKNNNALYFNINIEDINNLDTATLDADFAAFKDSVLNTCGIDSEVE